MAKGKKNQSSSSTPMEDNSNPHFLPNGDSPSLVLVSHALTRSKYHSWYQSMLMALNAKNKLAFVDGSLSRPTATDLFVGPLS